MALNRVIWKKNIIAWSIQELEKAVRESKSTPPTEVMTTITKLRTFYQTASWADFQTDPSASGFLKDLDSINEIRNILITKSDSFMRLEENNINNSTYNKSFYDILEAMLIGFTEQWPRNSFKSENNNNEDEQATEKGPATFYPISHISYDPLTTFADEMKNNGALKSAVLPMDGSQIGVIDLRTLPPQNRNNPYNLPYTARDLAVFTIKGAAPKPRKPYFYATVTQLAFVFTAMYFWDKFISIKEKPNSLTFEEYTIQFFKIVLNVVTTGLPLTLLAQSWGST